MWRKSCEEGMNEWNSSLGEQKYVKELVPRDMK